MAVSNLPETVPAKSIRSPWSAPLRSSVRAIKHILVQVTIGGGGQLYDTPRTFSAAALLRWAAEWSRERIESLENIGFTEKGEGSGQRRDTEDSPP
jgi:hypothetical protein